MTIDVKSNKQKLNHSLPLHDILGGNTYDICSGKDENNIQALFSLLPAIVWKAHADQYSDGQLEKANKELTWRYAVQ